MSIEVVELLVSQNPKLKDQILNKYSDKSKKEKKQVIEKIYICGRWI